MAEIIAALTFSIWLDSFFFQQPAVLVEFNPLASLAVAAQVVRQLGVLPSLWFLAGIVAAVILAWRAGPLGPDAAKAPTSRRRARIFIAALTGLGLAAAILFWLQPYLAYQRYIVGFEFGALLAVATLVADLTAEGRRGRSGSVILMIVAVVLAALAARPASLSAPFTERREIAQSMAACRDRFRLQVRVCRLLGRS